MQILNSLILTATVAVAGMTMGPPDAWGAEAGRGEAAQEHTLTGDWIVEEADNVCGLTDARQIANPVVVDYDELINATSEMKEMKRRGIGKDTPEGQVLYNKAVDRVRTAAAKVMKEKGYDSVWKKISHRKGKRAPSITDAVKDAVEK